MRAIGLARGRDAALSPRDRWPRSATARLALLSLFTILACVAIVLGIVYAAVDRQIVIETQTAVEDDRSLAHALIDGDDPAEIRREVDELLREPTAHGRTMLVVDPQGHPIAGDLSAWPPVLGWPSGWRVLNLYRIGAERAEPIGLVADRLSDGSGLLVGRTLTSRERLQSAIATASAAALAAAIVLALFGAWLVTRFVDARVAEAARAADRFAAGDLARRLDGADIGDPFGRLAAALNGMFDRVAGLMTELRVVTDSMAHDLRSPLTRLRLRAERALDADDAARRHCEINAVIGEADGMLKLVSTLLAVARAEAGVGREEFTNVDGAAILADLAEMYEPVAEDRAVALTLDAPTPVTIRAHAQLLAQALANLVDNALKHGGGAVRLFAETSGGRVRLGVADRGTGIPRDDRDAMLKRFGRADAARSTPGAGLGLSLATAIAHLHDGRLVLSNNEPGLIATIELPASR